MKAVLDAIFEFLWNIPEINLWPYVIALIVVMFAMSFIVQTRQMKKAARSFREGAIDDKTVKLCEKFRRRSIFPQSAEMHDMFCCMLCSMHMERREEDLFFANLNDIKKLTPQITRQLQLLLVAYLTDQRNLDLMDMYQKQKTEEQSVADWLAQQEIAYNPERLKTAFARIANPLVLEILKSLTEKE